MSQESAIVVFDILNRNLSYDLEIPLNISANELVIALNQAYKLNIDIHDIKNCFMKTENPIALLHGNKTLREYGIHNGSILIFDE